MPASDAWIDLDALAATAENPFPGDGEIAAAVREFDWAATSLGPIPSWSNSLLTVVRLILSSQQPMCIFWGPELRLIYNDGYKPMLGGRADAALGQPFHEVWPEIWDEILPITRSALSGVGQRMEEMPLTMTRNGYPEQTFWTFAYTPIRDDDGEIAGIINTTTEVTSQVLDRQQLAKVAQDSVQLLEEQRQSNRQRMVLQRELAHRMKNTLAIVQAIVSQTLRKATDIETVGSLIAGRLAALSSAQDVLTETSWQTAGVAEVVEQAMKPHADSADRILTNGPAVEISAQQALGLSLALHELATNATKYGALSVSEGRVELSWHVDDELGFDFVWQEIDGPPVVAVIHKGFGSRLTERVVPGYFGGSASMDYAATGVRYRLQGKLEAED